MWLYKFDYYHIDATITRFDVSYYCVVEMYSTIVEMFIFITNRHGSAPVIVWNKRCRFDLFSLFYLAKLKIFRILDHIIYTLMYKKQKNTNKYK